MNSTVAGSPTAYARSSGRAAVLHIDSVTVALVLAISLLGLVMVTSASVSIASKESGQTFYYLERQLVLMLMGGFSALVVFCIPTRSLERLSFPLLVTALILLFAVLIPGLGHAVNGSRRWLRILTINFQVSELARVLVLIYIASYAARRQDELRGTFAGLAKPLGLLCCAGGLLLIEPDFGAATVLFATGFGVLFLAGARLRYVIAMTLFAAAGFGALAMSSGYRVRRLKAFLDPWADPYNTGFQLTQSLIAIGRGQWFGVGLGESVQKLFYLPEAHTDFLFAVLAEELGLAGVLLTLALFIALVWRSFYIARLASDAGLKFQAYLASGFGLWVGIQAFINIGVNMGVLPTKGLTLPLMSYGRSSLIVSLAWVGVLLRVYHEVMLEKRGSATVRQRSSVLGERQARAAARGRGEARAEGKERQDGERTAMEAKASAAPEQGELLADDWEDEPT
jgi:cell division protein FtsW